MMTDTWWTFVSVGILLLFTGVVTRWALPRSSDPDVWADMDGEERTIAWLILWGIFAVPTVAIYMLLDLVTGWIERLLT